MFASELLGKEWLEKYKDVDITGIAYDSRNVLEGNAFVCIKGFETDGHKYAKAAEKNGAALIIAEDKVDVDIPVWYVDNSRIVGSFGMASLFCAEQNKRTADSAE